MVAHHLRLNQTDIRKVATAKIPHNLWPTILAKANRIVFPGFALYDRKDAEKWKKRDRADVIMAFLRRGLLFEAIETNRNMHDVSKV